MNTSDHAIVARGLSKHFGGVPALDGLTFSVRHHEILCIVGPNGAGKSTLFRALSGIAPPDSGSISILGTDISGLSSREVARLGVATKFQVPRVFSSLTAGEHINLATQVGHSVVQMIGSRDTGAPSDAAVLELLGEMGLDAVSDKSAGELGHGERQWLEIVMTLATSPRLLLLDEPGAGMSPDEKIRTAELLERLSDHMTILVIEHDLNFVKLVAHRVLVMHQGGLLIEGSFKEISSDPEVGRVYLGSSER